MDQSGASGYPQKANEAMQQPPRPEGPPPSYNSLADPGEPQNFGYMHSQQPGQSGYVHASFPGQSAPQQPGAQYGYPSTAVVVTQPGLGVVTRIRTQPQPQTYMTFSIIGCIFCVWPIGIGAILASSNVQSALARGDIQAAAKSSKTAKLINIINYSLGFALIMLFTILFASFRTYRRKYYY